MKHFITRLKKVKDSNPYEIDKIERSENFDGYSRIYRITFDDVILETGCKYGFNRTFYKLVIDGEIIDCRSSYKRKIYNLVDGIKQKNIKSSRISKLKSNINPAADLL
jgi:hypothetical protein